MNKVINEKSDEKKRTFLSNKTFNIASSILFILGVIDDILIKYKSIPYWLVSDDYIGIVFGGLCTVAALGSAIQSIIIGAYSNKIFGFTVGELANFSASKIRITRVVCLSLSAIVIALPALALNFCSTVSMITVIVVAYMAYSSVQVWQLLSDAEYEKFLIKAEVEIRGAVEPEFFFNVWFLELHDAIIANNTTRRHIYIELIKSVVDKCDESGVDTSNVLAKYLAAAFDVASLHLGFVETYKQVLCLNAPREQMEADLDSIIFKYIGTIKYSAENYIQNFHIASTIDDILENLDIEDFIKIRYVFSYYQSVVDNSTISEETRYQLLNSIVEKLCYLRDGGTGEVRGKILLYIAKHSIFENESEVERKKIIIIIVNNLLNENRYSTEDCYWSVVSQLFRGLYFYSVYETETLCSEYRTELAKLYGYASTGKNNLKVTLSSLVNENPELVIKWLTRDAVYCSGRANIFDYFPANFYCKTSIWVHENLLHFAFFAYSIFGYGFNLFPAANIILDKNVDIGLKKKICREILEISDEQFQLNEHAISKLHEMQTFLGNTGVLPDQYFVDNFKFFNEHLRDIETTKNQAVLIKTSADAEKLFSELVPLINKLEPFKYNYEIPIDNGQRIRLRPYLRTVDEDEKDTKYAAQRKLYEITKILNMIISKTLPPEKIEFDFSGVKKLLELLQGNTYLFTNYIYVNDLAINVETKTTKEYALLKEAISKIFCAHSKDLNSAVFLKESEIEFNMHIINYQLDFPTDEQCEKFINSNKVAEGKYRIDGIIQDFAGAMKFVHENYRAESSEICIATNITKDSGFKVSR